MNANTAPELVTLEQEWRIGNELHRGGFGAVYAATNAEGIQAVAKFVPKVPGAARESLFVELDSVPNVIPVLDLGEWTDYFVLVMPRAEMNLREHVEQTGGRLSVDEAVPILLDIATALAALEGQVVHRDIKPENILRLNGEWCLTDFGIARYAGATTAPDTRKFSMTPIYAAPEQWQGDQADSSADIYALGIVAFEMLQGEPPFSGPMIEDYRRQHIGERPPAADNAPLRIRTLVDECLYKAPESRPLPQSLIGRLNLSLNEPSPASKKLQEANALAVSRQAEEDRKRTLAHLNAQRRQELLQAAETSLKSLINIIDRAIRTDAPAIKVSDTRESRTWSLNDAKLAIASIRPVNQRDEEGPYEPVFDIVAHSSISIQKPPDTYGHRGRAHSLFYCDAQEEGKYRWYETAFMHSPLIARGSAFNPFALEPGPDAAKAIGPVMEVVQVAWPFTPVDQGEETEFVERWIDWFASAASGQLRAPTYMPERSPQGSWRLK